MILSCDSRDRALQPGLLLLCLNMALFRLLQADRFVVITLGLHQVWGNKQTLRNVPISTDGTCREKGDKETEVFQTEMSNNTMLELF